MQIYSIFGPNFYINSDTRGFSESLLQNHQEESSPNTLRSSLWDSLMRLVSNIDVNILPATQNSGTADFSDMVFFVDDDLPSVGLSLNDMNQYTTLEVYTTSENEEETICNICQNPISDGTVIRRLNGCSHKFHTNCVDRWLMNHNSCPICRAAIRPNPDPPTGSNVRSETENGALNNLNFPNTNSVNSTIPLASIPLTFPFPSNNSSFRRFPIVPRTSTSSVLFRVPNSTNETQTTTIRSDSSSPGNTDSSNTARSDTTMDNEPYRNNHSL